VPRGYWAQVARVDFATALLVVTLVARLVPMFAPEFAN
jgi:hypothetical protein